MRTFVVVQVLLLHVVTATIEETEKNCNEQENCVTKEECPAFLEKYEIFKNTNLRKNSQEYKNLKQELTEAICNKDEKAVCCNKCNEEEECISQNECKDFTEEYDRYKTLRNSEEKRLLGQVLRDRICEKRRKYVCCPKKTTPPRTTTPSTSQKLSPNYLPRLGDCGKPSIQASNVVGGEDTQPGDYPFLALLGYEIEKEIGTIRGKKIIRKEPHFVCAGTLINRWYVLTAAHCQGKREETKLTKVRLGEWKVGGYGTASPTELPDEQNFDITENDFTLHEGYETLFENNHKNVVNDIALIKLPRPAQLNAGVQIACLPVDTTEFTNYLNIKDPVDGLVGRRPSVVGWGRTHADQLKNWNGVGSRVQQYVQLPVLSKEECTEQNNKLVPRDTQICAGGENGKDSCRGDSGGGLYIPKNEADIKCKVQEWYLIGIVSFGSKDCGNGHPGIYTRVSEYISWITENLK